MAFKKHTDEATSFSLTNTNSEFSNKSKDIFAGLEALEQKHNAHQKVHSSLDDDLQRDGIIKDDPVDEDDNKRFNRQSDSHRTEYKNRRDWKQHPNRSSKQHDSEFSKKRRHSRDDFRKPRNLPPRAKKIPDHEKNPENWTCYSLEDVSENDMSDRSTKRAALDFIFERKNEREKQERIAAGLPAEEEKFESNVAACSKGRITFSKRKIKRPNVNMNVDGNLETERNEKDSDRKINDEVVEITKRSSNYVDEKSEKLSVFNEDEDNKGQSLDVDCDDEQSTEPAPPMFKSRKRNVKKQIRHKISFEDEEDDEDNII